MVASATAFLDTMYFTVLIPLLPHYREAAGLSEAQVGVLAAGYAVGSLVAAIPSGLLAARIGPRQTALWGFLLLAGSSLAFGWSTDLTILTCSRAVQGAAGAFMFAGALTWLISAAPLEKRGKVLGTATAAGIFGALAGPPLGAIGVLAGPKILFSVSILIPLLLASAALTVQDATQTEKLVGVVAALRTRPFRNGLLLLIAPSICFGVLAVLAPLRMDELGATAPVIALGFVLTALTEGLLAPLAGSRSDSIGRRRPYLAGTMVSAVAITDLAFVGSVPRVIVVLVVCSAGGGLAITPALAHISDAASGLSIPQAFAMAFSNFGWSAGTALGALVGGAIAEVAGFQWPLILSGAVLAVTFLWAWRPEIFMETVAPTGK